MGRSETKALGIYLVLSVKILLPNEYYLAGSFKFVVSFAVSKTEKLRKYLYVVPNLRFDRRRGTRNVELR